ncbi:class F sortase [Sinomonas sp. P47F7]|uniref:class F sortase n=1 Tax=Sinomonas sp. P47F7 TaxID=3410987 RepID=UPI003BF5C04B
MPADRGRSAPGTAPTSARIEIPDLGLRVPIVETTDKDGYLVLPDAPQIAHYVRAAPLGAARGSTVLAGHVNFADGALAPLEGLARIAVDAPVYLTASDGSTRRYRVIGLETYPKAGLSPSIFDREGPARLVLITCDQNSPIVSVGGVVQYANNTVATAVPWP